ncbi:transcriptional regulator [Bacterioplanes sanyensis]|uniref:Transcriptional regulator n=1 Tax=Bacterioplanes sanyensis TaxID=1249553 RepID=A0A222FEX9_9GAMM|nr:FMN-binding negative transcriptional regulator [Bacterioplanes sanyensis]ASP37568.1 transcriptional regulator [Bacterioplanes sanyensis]
MGAKIIAHCLVHFLYNCGCAKYYMLCMLAALFSRRAPMHIPSSFRQSDPETLLAFVQAYPLATLVVTAEGQLHAHHLPFLVRSEAGKQTIASHINRANKIWQTCQDGDEILLIFTGPDCYVSPNFYPSKQRDGKAVPTWNYSAVHVRGTIRFVHQAKWILEFLAELSDHHEQQHQAKPWTMEDAPDGFIEKLCKAVVGIEVTIESIEGQMKYSQNKTSEDFSGVVTGLSQGNEQQRLVAKSMVALEDS